MQLISRVLTDVRNWKGLAGWLNIGANAIEEECALDGAQAACYRRALVFICCNRQQSGDPHKVAEVIAEALGEMDHVFQAQQLRQLAFGEREGGEKEGWKREEVRDRRRRWESEGE